MLKPNQSIPEFTASEFSKCLIKLGFVHCAAGKHQHKYKHPNRKTTQTRPFIVFPDSIRRDKEFQKALVRTLVNHWGFTIEEVIEALK